MLCKVEVVTIVHLVTRWWAAPVYWNDGLEHLDVSFSVWSGSTLMCLLDVLTCTRNSLRTHGGVRDQWQSAQLPAVDLQ